MTRDEAERIWAAASLGVCQSLDEALASQWIYSDTEARYPDDDAGRELAIADVCAIEAARVLLGFAAQPEAAEEEAAVWVTAVPGKYPVFSGSIVFEPGDIKVTLVD